MADASNPVAQSDQSLLSLLAAAPFDARRAGILEAFCKEIGAVLDVDPDFIDESVSLPEMGADSLRLITLAGRVQSMAGFTIPPMLLPVDASIADTVDLLAEAFGEPDPVAVLTAAHRKRIMAAIDADLYLLDGTGEATDRVTAEEAANPKKVFLTGATGFVGAYLMRTLADRTEAQVHCLVRAKTEAAGAERLRGNLEKFGLWSPEIEARLTIEVGDLGAERFGLPAERYAQLAKEMDLIYHNGAAVHLTQP